MMQPLIDRPLEERPAPARTSFPVSELLLRATIGPGPDPRLLEPASGGMGLRPAGPSPLPESLLPLLPFRWSDNDSWVIRPSRSSTEEMEQHRFSKFIQMIIRGGSEEWLHPFHTNDSTPEVQQQFNTKSKHLKYRRVKYWLNAVILV